MIHIKFKIINMIIILVVVTILMVKGIPNNLPPKKRLDLFNNIKQLIFVNSFMEHIILLLKQKTIFLLSFLFF